MRYSIILAGMATTVVGQALDLGMVNAAPAPIATGPAITATADSVVYSPAASATAAVTNTAAAIATVSQVAKRGDIEARNLNLGSFICQYFKINCPAPATTSCTTTAKTTAKATTSPAMATTTSAAPIITSINTALPTPTGIPTTCTNTWTNTNAFTSATGCPTIFEVGTYCGFVNPEDPCATLGQGSGPVSNPDTVDAFLANPVLKSQSVNAKTPAGYAETFVDLLGATSAASYLGLYTLTSYDVNTCASYCDNTTTCTSFNVFIERDPSLNPSTEYCCPNPASTTNYKCTLWGSVIDNTTATNVGQYRDGFQVVITGSNGYTKANTTTPVTPPGWTKPQHCGGAHSHPNTCIGKHFFPGPYNPQLCASYAQAQNIKNGAGTGRGYSSNHCSFFNSFMLKKDGKPLGTYCSLFAQSYDPSVAQYIPGWQGGSYYDVETSWSFCLSP